MGSSNPPTNAGGSVLFESFTVLLLTASASSDKPAISYKYQLLSQPNRDGKKEKEGASLEQILTFSFPDHINLAPWEQPTDTFHKSEGEKFAFVLTDVDGSKKIGFCRRKVNSYAAKCYCFISQYPWFDLFDQLLFAIESQQKICGSETVMESTLKTILKDTEKLVKEFHRNPSSVRGQSVTLTLGQHMVNAIIASGPSDFGDISCASLLTSLGFKNVLRVLAAIICERRIILSSLHLGKLSSATMAIYSLLYPFAWQYIFIPVLPSSLLHYCCAPMPFIVGVHSTCLEELESMPLEETVFVDLDTDKFIGQDDLESLPSNVSALKSAIKGFVSNGKKTGVYNNKQILDSFMQFWISIFGKYKQFLVPKPTGNGTILDRDAFEQSLPKGAQKFFQTFKESQVFEQFARAVAERRPTIIPFEEAVTLHEQALADQQAHTESSGSSFLHFFSALTWRKDTSEKLEVSTPSTKPESAPAVMPPEPAPNPLRQSVRIAIQDLLEQQRQMRVNTIYDAPKKPVQSNRDREVDLASALEDGRGMFGLISNSTMEELKKRLSNTKLKHVPPQHPLPPIPVKAPTPPPVSSSSPPSQAAMKVNLKSVNRTGPYSGGMDDSVVKNTRKLEQVSPDKTKPALPPRPSTLSRAHSGTKLNRSLDTSKKQAQVAFAQNQTLRTSSDNLLENRNVRPFASTVVHTRTEQAHTAPRPNQGRPLPAPPKRGQPRKPYQPSQNRTTIAPEEQTSTANANGNQFLSKEEKRESLRRRHLSVAIDPAHMNKLRQIFDPSLVNPSGTHPPPHSGPPKSKTLYGTKSSQRNVHKPTQNTNNNLKKSNELNNQDVDKQAELLSKLQNQREKVDSSV